MHMFLIFSAYKFQACIFYYYIIGILVFQFTDQTKYSSSNHFVLDAIKKKNDSNLIDLTLFSEVTSIRNKCDTDPTIQWDNEEQLAKLLEHCESPQRISSIFNESDGGRVRDSVLEAFDPLLETEAKLTASETENYSGNALSYFNQIRTS